MLTLAMPAPLAARSLLWIGATNGVPANNWDIGVTPNWLNLANGTPTPYTQSLTVGDSVLFNDAASNGVVTLTTTLQPASVTVSNATLQYELGGAGTISGTNALIKQGSAALKLATPNNYSGGTSNLLGTLQVGSDSALGTGLLVLAGGNLSSDSTTARRLANNLLFTTATTLGNTANNGPLTFEGTIDLGNGARNLTISSPVTWSGKSANGGLNKLGTRTLTLTGTADWDATAEVRNGALILDGARFTNSVSCAWMVPRLTGWRVWSSPMAGCWC